MTIVENSEQIAIKFEKSAHGNFLLLDQKSALSLPGNSTSCLPLLHQKIIMNGILFFQIFLKSFENAHATLVLLLIRTSVKKILTSSAANEKKLFRFQKFTRGSEMSVLLASMREFQTVTDF